MKSLPFLATTRQMVTRLLLLALFGLAAVPSPGLAQGRLPDLSEVSIEELMAIVITSASRRPQRAGDAAAAVFVITSQDIRRSGLMTIPELLRMVPGVDVAQINANKWAVSVRGFNGLYANKLLVLIDGRSIYNRIFSGVFWDAEDLMLDDVDRIEVIRGPGAALWGANAVNGVINIVTKATADTQGFLVRVDAGRFSEQGAVRYGGTVGAARYRLYAQWTGRAPSLLTPDTRADDTSHRVTTGFRTDWTRRRDALLLEGSVTAGQARGLWPNLDPQTAARQPLADEASDARGGHFLGRWTRTRAGGGVLHIQSFVEVASRREPVGQFDRRTFDIDTQYRTSLDAHQDLVAGAGYRLRGDTIAGDIGFSVTPARDHASLATAFIQDEIKLFESRLVVTLGSQIQYDSDSGAGVQPTARAIWKGLPRQRLWAATSRALRTPSLYERGVRLDLPPVPGPSGLPLYGTLLGNPGAETESFIDAEAGYRLEIGTAASIDVTGFAGWYDHLRTQEQEAPVVRPAPPPPRILVTAQLGNQLAAETRGLELAAHWAPVPAWRLDGSYTAFRVTPQLAATSRDPNAAREDGSAPRTQWQIRSALSPVTRATLNMAIFRVGPLEQFRVDGYTRADVSAEWRFNNRLSAMAIGQNLFEAAHTESSGAGSLQLVTQVPRSASLRLRWTFQ